MILWGVLWVLAHTDSTDLTVFARLVGNLTDGSVGVASMAYVFKEKNSECSECAEYSEFCMVEGLGFV